MKNCIKPFFLSDVMRMCRIPSGIIIKENIHAALRHNGQEFERLFLPTTHFLIKHETKWQKLSLQI